MQFREFAEKLLGSKVKVKLLRILFSEEAITSERELAKLIGVSHGAVNRALKELNDQNIIAPMRVGNVTAWHLNKGSYGYKLLSDFPNAIKENPLEKLKTMLSELDNKIHEFTVKKAVIYGSVAEGRELPNSDIDLFIVVENEKERKNEHLLNWLSFLNQSYITMFGNKLSPNIFTYKDLTNPKNKKFLENVNKGIVLFER